MAFATSPTQANWRSGAEVVLVKGNLIVLNMEDTTTKGPEYQARRSMF
jgi:hypothetical protein